MKRKNVLLFLIVSFIIVLIFVIPTSSMAKDPIYKEPKVNSAGTDKDGLDDMIKDAEKFEEQKEQTKVDIDKDGKLDTYIDTGIRLDKLQGFSSSLYSVLLIAATAVTVLVGMILGIKYMTGSVEEKAEYKKMLLPFVAGCFAIYGSLGIWKLLVNLLSNV